MSSEEDKVRFISVVSIFSPFNNLPNHVISILVFLLKIFLTYFEEDFNALASKIHHQLLPPAAKNLFHYW